MRVIGHRLVQRRSQVYVAAGRVADDKPHRSTHLEGRYTHAAAHARLQRLGGDLRTAQHDDRVNGFQGNPLTSVGRRHQQCPVAMPHAGAMITNVHGAQVAHWNTTLSMYLVTFCGALVTAGKQCCCS